MQMQKRESEKKQIQETKEEEEEMDNTFGPTHPPFCPDLKSLAQDTELDIFQAERYFKESQDHKEMNTHTPVVDDSTDVSSSTPRVSSVSSSVYGYGRNYTSGSFHVTPTASSEASWNSRSGLLSNLPCGVATKNRRKKKGCYSPKWCFATICPCSGRKSVGVAKRPSPPPPPPPLHPDSKGAHNFVMNKVVDDNTQQIDKMSKLKLVNHQSSWRKEEDAAEETAPPKTIHLTGTSFRDTSTGFSFPVLSPGTGKLKRNGKIVDDPPRESLEVFQPLEEKENGNKSFDFMTDPQTPTNIDDEIASDASSDLFEIESLSTQTTSYPMSHRRCSLDQSTENHAPGIRHSLDGLTTPSIAPTECYEPSEASIAWSVTTAEGFDGGSITNMLITASGRCTDSNSCRVQMNAATKTKGNGLRLSLPVEPRPSTPLQLTKPTGKPPLGMSHSTRPMSQVLTRH